MGAAILLLSATGLATSGCGAGTHVMPAETEAVHLRGGVHGGQQPISLSTINLYSVDVANGAVSKLTAPVLSDLNGQFDISHDYTCPTPTTQMFITATDGNPGLTTGTNNTSIKLAAALGDCSNLTLTTYITIDEATSVAYAAEYSSMRNAATSAVLSAAFSRAMMLATFATGTSPGASQSSNSDGGTIPVNKINALANIVATCVNSSGAISSTTPCGKLFARTGSPTNTLDALTNLEGSPASYNAGSIFALAPSSGPFEPASMVAPPTWAVTAEEPIGSSRLTATPAAGAVGDSVVLTSNDPSVTTAICPFAPPLEIEFGSVDASGTFTSSEITATVPSGSGSGSITGTLATGSGSCTFPFFVQSVPAYALSTSSLTFASQAVGAESGSKSVTFSNNSGAAGSVLVGGFTIPSTPAASFKVSADNCSGATLAMGSSCTVSVVFNPSATGSATGTMTFYIDGVAVAATVALSGTGS